MCFRQVYSNPRTLVLLGWQNVEILAVRLSKRVLFYVGDDCFAWGFYYGHRFLHIPTLSVFSYYSCFALDSRYHSLIYAVGLMQFGAFAFLRVLYTDYKGVPCTFGKLTALCIGSLAPLPFSMALINVVR